MPTHAHSLRTRITIYFVLILTIAIAFLALASYIAGKKLLKDAAFNTLNSIRTVKTGQVEQYLGMLQDQCLSTSESTMIFDAIEALQQGFNAIQASDTELTTYKQELEKFYMDEFLPKLNKTATQPYQLSDYFPLDPKTITTQAWYLAQNPNALQKKSDYARAAAPHPYNAAHEQYHSIFKRYAKRVGIADLYLIDLSSGYVVYSLEKEIDFGTNLITGPLKDSGLGRSFMELQKTTDENFIKIIDFQFYNPSYGTPVGFISTPIFKHGKKIGGLVFKFPIDTINNIMTYDRHWAEVGLGKTGESYLIGKDKLMRTIAREYIENPVEYIQRLREHDYDPITLDKIQIYDTTVLLKKADLDIIRDILSGKTDTLVTNDTMGREVIFSYSPIKIGDINWYILIKINIKEAFTPVNTLLWYIIVYGLLIIMLSSLAAFVSIHMLTKPLATIIQVLSKGGSSTQNNFIANSDGSAEFETIRSAYNRIIAHTQELIKQMLVIHKQIAETQTKTNNSCTKVEHGLSQLAQTMHEAQKKSNTMLNIIKELDQITEQKNAYGAQITTLLKLIDTSNTTITKYIDDICNKLSSVETTLSSTTAPDVKAQLQQAIRTTASITPLLMNAHATSEQMAQLVNDITTQKDTAHKESLTLALEGQMQLIDTATQIIAQNNTTLGEIQKIQLKSRDSAAQLATLIEKART